MIKSLYADPVIDGHGFLNHIDECVIDCGVVPGTTTPLIEAYSVELLQHLQATSGTGGKPRNIALFRKVLSADPTAGTWQLLKMWVEGGDYNDASAAGSVGVMPDGTVHVAMSFGKNNAGGALQFQKWEASMPRSAFAAPIERLPSGGEKGEKGDPGPPGAGGITFLPNNAIALSPAWDARVLSAGVLVDVPSTFNVPVAQSYLVRFCAVASVANVRARAGTQAYPYVLTVCTQVAGVEIQGQGWIPGPQAWISPAQGTPQVWLQILGWS